MGKQGKDRTRKVIKGDIVFSSANNKQLFNVYLNDIKKYKTLTREEEVNLFKQLKSGEDVMDTIVKHNLKFVVTVAKKYQDVTGSSSITLEDLVNEGNIGLLEAIKRFDYEKGFKLISYAVFYIKQNIIAYIGNNIKNIRMSNNRYSLLTKLKRLESDLEQTYGRDIDDNELLEIAKTKGVFREEYDRVFLNDLKNNGIEEKSLNTVIGNDTDNLTLLDIIENKENEDIFDIMENKEIRNFINDKLLSKLPTYVKKTFEMYYGLNDEKQRTVKYIAEYLDTTESGVRLRIKHNIWKIRRLLRKDFKKLELNYENNEIKYGLIN